MLTDLPPPLTARPPRFSDAETVTALIAACELDMHGVVDVVVEDVRSDWRRPSFDLASDALVVVEGDRFIAYAEEFHERAGVWVHPSQTGRGIGAALLAWSEGHARRTGAGQVGQTISEHQPAARKLLRAHGYRPAWDTWVFQILLADRPAPAAPPAGVTLRALRRPDDDRPAYEIVESSFSTWPGRHGETFEDWVAANLDRPDVDPELIFVAEEDGRMIGVALSLEADDEGWVHQLAVAAPHRRRGIGHALLGAAFEAFAQRGLRTAGLSTDSRTGARGLYEDVGMRVLRSYARFTKPLSADAGGAERGC